MGGKEDNLTERETDREIPLWRLVAEVLVELDSISEAFNANTHVHHFTGGFGVRQLASTVMARFRQTRGASARAASIELTAR